MQAHILRKYTRIDGTQFKRLEIRGVPTFPEVIENAENVKGNVLICFMFGDFLYDIEILCTLDEAAELGRKLIARAVR